MKGKKSSTIIPIILILLLKTMKNNYNKRYYQHIEQLHYKPTVAPLRNLAGSSFNKSVYACQIEIIKTLLTGADYEGKHTTWTQVFDRWPSLLRTLKNESVFRIVTSHQLLRPIVILILLFAIG